jgi:hypothetical protein
LLHIDDFKRILRVQILVNLCNSALALCAASLIRKPFIEDRPFPVFFINSLGLELALPVFFISTLGGLELVIGLEVRIRLVLGFRLRLRLVLGF